MPAINFPTIDLPKFDLPEIDADRVANIARDAAYITVGFGVLAFQKAQVRRQELIKQINTSKLPVNQVSKLVEAQVRTIDSRIVKLEARLDAAVEQVAERLPAPADALVGQAHGVAKTARKQVRDFAVKAA